MSLPALGPLHMPCASGHLYLLLGCQCPLHLLAPVLQAGHLLLQLLAVLPTFVEGLVDHIHFFLGRERNPLGICEGMAELLGTRADRAQEGCTFCVQCVLTPAWGVQSPVGGELLCLVQRQGICVEMGYLCRDQVSMCWILIGLPPKLSHSGYTTVTVSAYVEWSGKPQTLLFFGSHPLVLRAVLQAGAPPWCRGYN